MYVYAIFIQLNDFVILYLLATWFWHKSAKKEFTIWWNGSVNKKSCKAGHQHFRKSLYINSAQHNLITANWTFHKRTISSSYHILKRKSVSTLNLKTKSETNDWTSNSGISNPELFYPGSSRSCFTEIIFGIRNTRRAAPYGHAHLASTVSSLCVHNSGVNQRYRSWHEPRQQTRFPKYVI